jgi:hypothetical protein
MSRHLQATRPKLPEPFPVPLTHWRCEKTGIMVPKQREANLAWRMDMMEKASKDKGMQKDLLAACAESQLFWINAFVMTFHQFDVDETGKRIESRNADQPMITWPIQDELLLCYEDCIAKGEDVLDDKARDMGVSWCSVDFMHWLMLFRQSKKPTELLEMSRNEDYVDKPGNMKALFQKHDYINQWLPDWMRPPDCFRGQANRSHMHWHNPITNATLDGESTTKHAARGDRRLVGLLDEFGAVQNGSAMRMASRDACLVRIINSTSVPGSEYNKWRSDKTIKVFILPYWEHPEKGAGRYVKQTKTGKWEIRSPWFDKEEKERGAKYMATEVLREDTEPGLSFFQTQNIDNHEAMYARPPSSVWDIKWRKTLGYEDVAHFIRTKDRSMIFAVEKTYGPLKIWCDLIDGRPDQTLSYIFGIDTGKGQGASNSVISIKCKETGEKVGEWADATYPPYDFAQIIIAVAMWFGGAKPFRLPFLKWENNGPGWDVGRIIVKKCLYPYFYRNESVGKTIDKKKEQYGFQMSRESKYLLLSIYDKALSYGGYANRSKIALEEARSIVHFPSGGIGPAYLMHENASAKKTHADRVIADALTIDDKELPKIKSSKKTPPRNSAGYRFLQHRKNMKRGRVTVRRGFDFTGAC